MSNAINKVDNEMVYLPWSIQEILAINNKIEKNQSYLDVWEFELTFPLAEIMPDEWNFTYKASWKEYQILFDAVEYCDTCNLQGDERKTFLVNVWNDLPKHLLGEFKLSKSLPNPIF